MACSKYPECKNTRELPKEGDAVAQQEEGAPEEEILCDKCGKPMVRKKGRFGEFMACSGYPECKSTQKIASSGDPVEDIEVPDEECPTCGSKLVQKHGPYGAFVACGDYPDCKYIKQQTTGVDCPDCSKGQIVHRRSRRGRIFYGCSAFPDCKFVLWKKPVDQKCPDCESPYLVERVTKKKGVSHLCNNPDCDYEKVVEAADTG